MSKNKHMGSTLQSFFEETGEWEEVKKMAKEKGKIIFENHELKVTEYPETVYIEDKTAPPMSDSTLAIPIGSFRAMVSKCKRRFI